MRPFILIASAAALQTLLVASASTHALLDTPQASAGGRKAVIVNAHCREAEAARTVRGGAVAGGVGAVTWSGGELTDGRVGGFALRGTPAGIQPGDTPSFGTVQDCAGGRAARIDVPARGQDARAPKRPAPSPTILASDSSAQAHPGHAGAASASGDVTVRDAWARAMLPGQPAGGGYLTIDNGGTQDDRLLSVSSPAAGRVEVHMMEMKDNVMVMRPIDGDLTVPAGGTVTLEPGGLHIMFMQVRTPFREGTVVPATLEFEKAGRIELQLKVGPARGGMPEMDHSGHGQ